MITVKKVLHGNIFCGIGGGPQDAPAQAKQVELIGKPEFAAKIRRMVKLESSAHVGQRPRGLATSKLAT
jgi:hypothetical protein